MSEDGLADLLKRDYLVKNLLNRLLRLAPKTNNLQIYQCRIVITLAGYEKSQKKDKDRWGNKINLIVKRSSNTEVSVYYYVIV